MRPCKAPNIVLQRTIHRTIVATCGPTTAFTGPRRFLTCPRESRVAPPSPLKSPGSVWALLHRRPLKRVSCAIASRLTFPPLFEIQCVMYSAIHNQYNRRWFCECFATDFYEEVTVTANWSKPTSRYEAGSEAAEAGPLPDCQGLVSRFLFLLLLFYLSFIDLGLSSLESPNVIKSCGLISCNNVYRYLSYPTRRTCWFSEHPRRINHLMLIFLHYREETWKSANNSLRF